jgi:biotin carboxyl carrier protein
MKLFAHWQNQRWEFEVERDGDHLVIADGAVKHRLQFDELRTHFRSFLVDSKKVDFGWMRNGEKFQIVIGGNPYDITIRDGRSEQIESLKRATAVHAGVLEIRAPISGMITKVLVKVGDKVKKDQPLVTLNAMKMENEIASPQDGEVKEISTDAGRTVNRDDPLIVLA